MTALQPVSPLSRLALLLFILFALACASPPAPPPPAGPPVTYDVVIRGGTIYDGSGGAPYAGDVAIEGDRIAAVAPRIEGRGEREVDARGLAVAPGFINMLSWATETLLADGRAMSDVKQGVTLEVFGEGFSMGPLNARMKRQMVENQGDIRFDVPWTTLGQYLEHLERKGVSVNVASFVGATTLRMHEIGKVDRAPTPAELARMQALVRQAMEEGALGVGSSLIRGENDFTGDIVMADGRPTGKVGRRFRPNERLELVT